MEYYIWKVKGSSILVMSGKPDILHQTTRTYDQVVLTNKFVYILVLRT